jgi:nucleoid-associated protein YgaU
MPTVTSPPIVIPGPSAVTPAVSPRSNRPQVESFDEETYRCKFGDTFARISQAYYHTEKYGSALMLFNVNHPLASEAVRTDPQHLQAGQAIYIPPTSVLGNRYGALFPEIAPHPTATAGDGARTSNAAPRPTGSVATPQNLKSYRVQPRGETMWEIARLTLGDSNRWKEIMQLNPGLRSEYPIPGGTLLKLPADARVQPQQ